MTVSRFSPADTIFTYNSAYPDDVNDPRNYNLTHTFKSTQTTNVFYPSITAYSLNTGSYDDANMIIGPLTYPMLENNTSSASLTSLPIHLLKVRSSGNNVVYSMQIDENIAFLKHNKVT